VSALYRGLARPVLFRLGRGDAEAAHEWTLHRLAQLSRRPALLAALRARYAVADPVTVFGVRFANRVGLAAGMDKDGVALPAWPALGFGFVEVGTVTAHAQPGNDRPRVFRLAGSEALINRMGFNNAGAAALAARLRAVGRLPVPLGVSLGKSKLTPLDDAVSDYLESLRRVRPYADYLAINVSSPNTPGLRQLQDRDQLDALLSSLVAAAQGVPVLVKVAPDLTEAAIEELVGVAVDRGVAGVIATNTTLSREGLVDPVPGQAGGVSGRPLAARARSVVSQIYRQTGGRLPVVGVGGITTPDDAARMMDAGASLVQLYTGFIYHGPALVRQVAIRLSDPGRGRTPLAPGPIGSARRRDHRRELA
jgi:dihydroorotate dehydrogenase